MKNVNKQVKVYTIKNEITGKFLRVRFFNENEALRYFRGIRRDIFSHYTLVTTLTNISDNPLYTRYPHLFQ